MSRSLRNEAEDDRDGAPYAPGEDPHLPSPAAVAEASNRQRGYSAASLPRTPAVVNDPGHRNPPLAELNAAYRASAAAKRQEIQQATEAAISAVRQRLRG